jgi:hypothetical protein
MVRIREIERNEWNLFLERFNRLHEGWLSTMEVRTDAGTRTVVLGEPLRSIVLDEDPEGSAEALVTLGNNNGRPATQHVPEIQSIRLRETLRGAHEGLEIETASGETLTLHFRAAIRPEDFSSATRGFGHAQQ